GVRGADQLVHGIVVENLRAHAELKDTAGYLALAESGNVHLPDDLTVGLLQSLLDLLGPQFDLQADSAAIQSLDGGLHPATLLLKILGPRTAGGAGRGPTLVPGRHVQEVGGAGGGSRTLRGRA